MGCFSSKAKGACSECLPSESKGNANWAAADGTTPLHLAAANKHVACTRALISNGANVHATDDDGWTPLHEAANWGDTAVIEVLLANGADKTAKHRRGIPSEVAEKEHHTLASSLLRPDGYVNPKKEEQNEEQEDEEINENKEKEN